MMSTSVNTDGSCRKRDNVDMMSPSDLKQPEKVRIKSPAKMAAMFTLPTLINTPMDRNKLSQIVGSDAPNWVVPMAEYLYSCYNKVFEEMYDNIDYLNDEIQEWKEKYSEALNKYKGMAEAYQGVLSKVGKLEMENEKMKTEKDVEDRKMNLIINGVSESQTDLGSWWHDFTLHDLKLRQWNIRPVDIARIGRPHTNNRNNTHRPRPRPIKVTLSSEDDKLMLIKSRRELYGTGMSMFEDFPPEVNQKRRRLTPISSEAYRQGYRSSVRADKLIIQGKTYTVDTLDKLPRSLIDSANSCRQTDTQIAFFRKFNMLSNHAPSQFKIEDEVFNSNEQWFLREKCRVFGHDHISNLIMREDDPALMVKHAKVCQGINDEWEKVKVKTMYTGAYHKFTQNPEFKDYLLSTGEKTIVEASKFDTEWGVGIDVNDPAVDDPRKWKPQAQNLLGKVLMEVRKVIRTEEQRHDQMDETPSTSQERQSDATLSSVNASIAAIV